MADFMVANHGSVFLLTPVTETAVAWIVEHVDSARQRWAGAIAIESRCIADIVAGAQADGLTVE